MLVCIINYRPTCDGIIGIDFEGNETSTMTLVNAKIRVSVLIVLIVILLKV